MVTLDLADELVLDEGGSGLAVEADRDVRAGGLPGRRPEPGGAGPGGLWPQRGGPADQADPAGRRAGRRLGRRRGRPALGRLHRPRRGGRASGADVPFCVVGGRARVDGVGERVDAAALRGPPRSSFSSRPSAWTRARSTGPGTTTAGARRARTSSTAAALAVEPRLARWRDALREPDRERARLAGSGSTWFVEGEPTGRAATGGDGDGELEVRVGAETARLVRRAAPCRRAGKGTEGRAGAGRRRATCRPGAASGWPSASSCASSCASACGAS